MYIEMGSDVTNELISLIRLRMISRSCPDRQ